MRRHTAPVHSALYEGQVTHVRRTDVQHSFSAKVALCYLDVDELDAVLAQHPLWSTRRWRPAQVRPADYGGEAGATFAEIFRRRAGGVAGGEVGPVRLLAHPRIWAWCFNPLALAFCFDPVGEEVAAVVATVTNTPWGERHDYVLPAGRGSAVDVRMPKELHVSPFLSMGQTYRFRISPPGDRLHVGVDVDEGPRTVLRADMHLRRRPLDRHAMTGLLVGRLPVTWRVSRDIYWQAAQLAKKGATLYRHPSKIAR